MTAQRTMARVTHVFAGMPTADLDVALAWYERFLGRPPDRRPNDCEAVWQLADSGLVYVVADARRAGEALITLIVDDLDAWLSQLAERGVEVGDVKTLPGIARRVAITDPDRNTITIAQLMSLNA